MLTVSMTHDLLNPVNTGELSNDSQRLDKRLFISLNRVKSVLVSHTFGCSWCNEKSEHKSTLGRCGQDQRVEHTDCDFISVRIFVIVIGVEC